MMRATATRFGALWERVIAVPPSPSASDVYDDLVRRLDSPGRVFHNLRHIDDCLCRFDEVATHLDQPDAVEIALWFHDAIYEPGDPNNERRSADLFVAQASGGSHALRALVVSLIMATERKGAPRSDDARFVDDIDLAGFGVGWAAFARSSAQLRREFADLTDADYYRGQWRFLSRLRRRPNFFRTAYFRDRYEEQAQSNLDRLLADLARRGYGAA
jgi:predicted metal-dependent HD superfamily phosphohydrolase